MSEPFDLGRFVRAQEPVIGQVRRELAAGQKTTHWMWFVFPQLRGLGLSAMAMRYGIASIEEARGYLQHAVLGARLIECTALVNRVEGRSIRSIFGAPDDMKFRSCMTLFAAAVSSKTVFHEALAKYFADTPDPLTMRLLEAAR